MAEIEVVERGPLDAPIAVAATFFDGRRTIRVGDVLHERGRRARTVEITTPFEVWVALDRHGTVTSSAWMAPGVRRNTSRRRQAIAVERLLTAYEPRNGWALQRALTEEDSDGR